jgi:hypothetical protein
MIGRVTHASPGGPGNPVAPRRPWRRHFIFASVAALGAGLAVAVDVQTHAGHLGPVAAGYAVAAPVAVFLLVIWLLQTRRQRPRAVAAACPVAAVLVLLSPRGPVEGPAAAVVTTGLVVAALVALATAASRRSWSSAP